MNESVTFNQDVENPSYKKIINAITAAIVLLRSEQNIQQVPGLLKLGIHFKKQYTPLLRKIISSDSELSEHAVEIEDKLGKTLFLSILFPLLGSMDTVTGISQSEDQKKTAGDILITPAILAYLLDLFIDELDIEVPRDIQATGQEILKGIYQEKDFHVPEGTLTTLQLFIPGLKKLKEQQIPIEMARWWLHQSLITYERGQSVEMSWKNNKYQATVDAAFTNTGLSMVASSLYIMERLTTPNTPENFIPLDISQWPEKLLKLLTLGEVAIRVTDDISDKKKDRQLNSPNVATIYEYHSAEIEKWPMQAEEWLQKNSSPEDILEYVKKHHYSIQENLSQSEKILAEKIMNILTPALLLSPKV